MIAGKPIIGLAGGIGSGKSAVASILTDLGAGVVDSDQLNHAELNTPEVLEELRGWWGPSVVGADGRIDREAVREIVLRDASQRDRLERLVHPRIARRTQELMARFGNDPGIRAVIWDAPLLFEVGLSEQCDKVVFVESDRECRVRRVSETRGWTRGDLDRFEAAQKPLDFKRNRADYVVVNNSDVENLRKQVQQVFRDILTGW